MKSEVYFTRNITPEAIVEAYSKLGIELPGKVAVKVHSGEKGNQNYLHPDFFKPMVDKVHGTIVECNTAYGDAAGGVRDNTESHWKLIEDHEWTKYFDVDLALIHSAGKTDDRFDTWKMHADINAFPEAMADAASSVTEHFKGRIAFINVMKNLSVDCDCCMVAEDPCMKDIGILASLDPVAIDQACIDLVLSSDDPGKEHFMERVNSRNGIHTIEAAAELGIGSREYELIEF